MAFGLDDATYAVAKAIAEEGLKEGGEALKEPFPKPPLKVLIFRISLMKILDMK